MTKGLIGEKRPADFMGCEVAVAQVSTVGGRDMGYMSKNRRNSGVAGAEARMKTVSSGKLSEVASKAASATWRKENDMTEQSVRSRLSALYAEKKAAGLVDVKFLVGSIDEASFDEVAEEVLRLEEAVRRGEYEVLRFNDKH